MAYSRDRLLQIWVKANIVRGHDKNVWRKDQCGAWIKWAAYGNRKSQFGWEVDHITPSGTDRLSNLRPLQWENNVAKGNGRLKCVKTAAIYKGVHRNILT